MTPPPDASAALGCRAHTGWAAVVLAAGDLAHPQVLARTRVELVDRTGPHERAVYQRSRGLVPEEAEARVAAVRRIATERAAAALGQAIEDAEARGVRVRRCAVPVGDLSAAVPLTSILASHALAHAAEGRLYQEALLDGAEACGLAPVPVARASIRDEACWTFGVSLDDLEARLAGLRHELGSPWAEDQKLAALAALLALAAPT